MKERRRVVFIASICISVLIIAFIAVMIGFLFYKPVEKNKIDQLRAIAEYSWMKKAMLSNKNEFSISGEDLEEKTSTQYLTQNKLKNVTISLKDDIIRVSHKNISVEIDENANQEMVIIQDSKGCLIFLAIFIILGIIVIFVQAVRYLVKTKNL